MTDKLNPKRISQLLNQGTWQMDEKVLAALSDARQKALLRQSVRAPVFTFATSRWTHLLPSFSAHQWVSAGLLAIMLVIGADYYWHHAQEQQIADLDVAILTDDLPIEVFVD
ncbi:MAG: DUF3619 family protein [Gallionella sp.]|nr:DUF3619 family protein [Gallionella sp.]